MAKAKTSTKNKRTLPVSNSWLMVAATLVVGAVMGYLIGVNVERPDARYKLASKSELNAARQDIKNTYKDKSIKECLSYEIEDAPKPTQISCEEEYEAALKVNKYGNRAVMKWCAVYEDCMLYKKPGGTWEIANVSISFHTRANPMWQVECMIDDIHPADDVVRPENSGIDLANLLNCEDIKNMEFTTQIMKVSGERDNMSFSEEDVREYLDTHMESFNE